MTHKPPVQVESTSRFKQILKRLRKKYAHVIDDLKPLLEILTQGQTPGINYLMWDIAYTRFDYLTAMLNAVKVVDIE